MKIHKVELAKNRLEAMPPAERTALLLLGHARNEIGLLRKFLLLAMQGKEPNNKIVDYVQAGQTLILMRMLLGKLFEAWRLFNRRVQPLRAKHLPTLSIEARAAVDELGRHFANDSRLARIRNGVSFHYLDDDDLVEANWRKIPESDPWDFYLSDLHVNTFYYASELVITGVAAQLAIPEHARGLPGHLSEEQVGIEELCGLATGISGKVILVFDEFIAAIATSALPDLAAEEIDIGDGAKSSQLSLPFFWDETDYADRKSKARGAA